MQNVSAAPGRGAIVAIGGAEDKRGDELILSTFVGMAGGEDARIAVIPAASEDAADAGERYTRLFRELGAGDVRVMEAQTREAAHREPAVAALRGATGIFMSGGDQARLADIICDTPVQDCLFERTRAGATIAGTSAGAAILASHMIAGGESGATPRKGMAEIRPGLGLLENFVVDTHFGERGRTGRLMLLQAMHPEVIALGVDEDTAAVIGHDLVMRVIGGGGVTVVDGGTIRTDVDRIREDEPAMVTGVEVHVVTSGYAFDLRACKFVPPLSPAIGER